MADQERKNITPDTVDHAKDAVKHAMDSIGSAYRAIFTEDMPIAERVRHLGGALGSLSRSLEAGAQVRQTVRRDTPDGVDPDKVVDADPNPPSNPQQ